jgi:hypothetical protein
MVGGFMNFAKTTMAALVGVVIGLSPAMAQQDITLKVASFAGPFGEALQKYAFDLHQADGDQDRGRLRQSR